MTNNLPLTQSQIEEMKMEFLRLDLDGDGQVSVEELESVLHSMRGKLKATDGDIRKAVKDMDRDRDGTINVQEYLWSIKNKSNKDLVRRALVQRLLIRKEFGRFDKDKSGFISTEEFMQVLQSRGIMKVTLDQVSLLIKDSDRDKNGEIDYEEFVLLMTK